ncbi:MAG: hypothetical protein IKM43_00620 [Clostridia bacterium]|nr:hypothetical protein [Clostridia bacterium]MBR6778646.1 hypothetical protein [Clostridia bacterium]
MGFFTKTHKEMAKTKSLKQLQIGYKNSEEALIDASFKGDKKALKHAMKIHGRYEYAILFRNTPQYKKCKKK